MARSHAFLNAIRLAGSEQLPRAAPGEGGGETAESPTARDRRRPFPQPRGETPTDTYGTHPSNGGALPWIANERRPLSVLPTGNRRVLRCAQYGSLYTLKRPPTAGCAVVIAPRIYLGCVATAGGTPWRHYMPIAAIHGHFWCWQILRRQHRQQPPFVYHPRERPTVRRARSMRIGGRFPTRLWEGSTSTACSW